MDWFPPAPIPWADYNQTCLINELYRFRQLNDVYKHVGWHQLRRLCGFHHDATDDEKNSTVDELCRLYVESIQFVDSFSATELRPNDFYVVLAGQLLWQMWTATATNDKHFWKAVVVLQSALEKSPANYHLRFMLIKFFNQAGKNIARSLQVSIPAENTKGGSITVPLTSCLTSLESAVWQLTFFAFICKTD